MKPYRFYATALLCFALSGNIFTRGLSDEEFNEFVSEIEDFVSVSTSNVWATNNDDYFSSENASVVDYGIFDFIIVGGGTAGGILANRLSEQERFTVLLVEAGQARAAIVDVLGLNSYLVASKWNWGYNTTKQTTGCLGSVNQCCTLGRGKGLGGSSSINDAFITRGNHKDFDQWADLGNIGWSFEDCLPYFKKTENTKFPVDAADEPYHGFDGMQSLSRAEDTPILTDALLSAFEELGNSYVDFNGKTQYGVGRPQFLLDNNTRASTAHSYIFPALNRPNLNITVESLVTKVLISNKTATGIEFWKNGTKYTATAGKEVIVSAGAVNSPQLLMLSGIGPEDELKKHGIEIIVDLPVGENYQDHPIFPGIYYRTNGSWYNNTLLENLDLWREGHRPLIAGYALQTVNYFNSEGKDNIIPEVEILTVGPPAVTESVGVFLGYNDTYLETLEFLESTTDVSLLMILLHPQNTGRVALKSNSAKDYPVIEYDYFGNDDDLEIMYNAIQYALKLNETDGFKRLGAYQLYPSVPDCDPYYDALSKDWWICVIRYTSAAGLHILGTTRFGVDPSKSVVNPDLKVHGIENLRVVDAGVIPSEISGHLNAFVAMVAEKAADIIKAAHQ